MSIYQSDYFIIPKENNYHLFEGINLNAFSEDSYFDEEPLWKNNKLNFDEMKNHLIDAGIEKGVSWSENLHIFGNNDTNCLKFFIENGKIVSASFRVYFIENFNDFLCEVINFCRFFNLLIVDNNLNILELNYEIVKNNILTSKAFYNYKKIADKFSNDD